ncbi:MULTISPECIES: ABC transporter permease [Pseudomonas]|jgi:polar amino acid transport system permease protein|uniref:ABC transporter permease n=1 Tax=Pseudomonas TaxID=286 RepID=UPI000DAA12D6|nr:MULTISPECIES: ABC transporter permease subunit [Pseudomonas]MDW3710752.1 ABC transporter permease subunit [Pseudomonas sp. 2023EL-01195]PZE10587.1 ABC transporter permease [Pseudomonas sp. 57B-090624]
MTAIEIQRLLFTDGWLQALAQGAVKTLGISIGAFVLGLSLGLVVALVKLWGPRWLVIWANCYTTLYRAVPELLLILLLYYAGSDLLNLLMAAAGQPPVEVNGFLAGIVVLGIVQGAYSAEIIRGAIEAIPVGQIEAGRAYGMKPFMVLRRVLVPSMLPHVVAGLSNLWLVLVKDSALISVVGYSELLGAGRQAAASTKHYLMFYLAVAAFYYLITLVSSLVFRRFEARFERWMPRLA